MLWIGLVARDSGVPASRRLGIRDEVAALAFDAAVSLRLVSFDNEKMKTNARLIANEVSKLFRGEDVLDAEVIGDRFADASTQKW